MPRCRVVFNGLAALQDTWIRLIDAVPQWMGLRPRGPIMFVGWPLSNPVLLALSRPDADLG